MIKRILNKIKDVKQSIRKSKSENEEFYKILSKYENRLNSHLNGFFREISDINDKKSMTLVFKMASGYKEVYYYYNLLSKGLDICEGLYDISNKKLWNLYEIWCYLKIHSIIKEIGYIPKNSHFIKVNSKGLTLSVLQNSQSKMIYQNKRGNKLELWYNKAYYSLPTTNQRPDTVLCLKGDKTKDRVYLFDAKYRIFIDKNGEIGPMEDDINVMHRYRDAIVQKNEENGKYERCVLGAFVLFPYKDEEQFKEHDFSKSNDEIRIGGIPFLPSINLFKNYLAYIIKSFVD